MLAAWVVAVTWFPFRPISRRSIDFGFVSIMPPTLRTGSRAEHGVPVC
jgi:hypothetical protein